MHIDFVGAGETFNASHLHSGIKQLELTGDDFVHPSIHLFKCLLNTGAEKIEVN